MLARQRTLLRKPFKVEILRREGGKRDENFIKCALIRGVNVIATMWESVHFYY